MMERAEWIKTFSTDHKLQKFSFHFSMQVGSRIRHGKDFNGISL